MDAAFLSLLACPEATCRAPLADGGDALTCTGCGRRYPLVDGIPVLIVEEALPPESAAP